MYRQHGFQDKDLLLETLVKDDTMTFFPEFNLLVVSSSYDPSEGPYNRTTAIFNARTSEIASGEFFKGCDYVSDMVFERGQDKAFAVIDSFDRDADGSCWIDPRMSMLAGLHNGAVSEGKEARNANYDTVKMMAEAFRAEHGSIRCGQLLGLEPGLPEGFRKKPCTEYVRTCAALVEKYLLG